VQQINTELSEAVPEKDNIMVNTKTYLTCWNKMAAGVHRPLEVIAFNANYIWRQCYKLSKHLQDLRIKVALLSETHLKPMRGSSFRIITYLFPERKDIPYAVCVIRTLGKGASYS
jgi:hypothetical protein